MPKHISEWLNAYLDGELKGSQLQRVETHLAECRACRAELKSLQSLSALLHEATTPEFVSPAHLAAQVNLRLPRRPTSPSKNKILEIGWWMVPVGLLGIWFFIGTSTLLGDILSAANGLGLLTGMSNWLVSSPANEYWSATLGQLGILSGNSLDWAASTETLTRSSLPLITLHVSIALLYLSWLAIWWSRHRRQEHGQLLEG